MTRPEPESSEQDRAKPPAAWRSLVSLAILGLVLLAIGLAQTADGQSVLRQAGFSSDSKPFTELYFPAPASLPAVAARRQAVAFVIRNDSHRSRVYSWTVAETGPLFERHGETVLGVGQQRTNVVHVRVLCFGKRVHLQVSLLDPAQSIGFWERCRA